MIARVPAQPDSDESKEGTAVHNISKVLLSALRMGVPQTDLASWVGMRDEETGVVYDEAMVDAAELYVDEVIEWVTGKPIEAAWFKVEEKLKISAVHASQCDGTPDLGYAVFPGGGAAEIHVWDLKYGFLGVDPYENWQLLCYAIGLWERVITANGWLKEQSCRIVLHIVQPRKFHVEGPHRVWEFNAIELRNYTNILERNAADALKPDAPLNAGDHCRYCEARTRCPEFQKYTGLAQQYSAETQLWEQTPQDMAIELGHIQDAMTALRAAETGIEAELTEHLNKGAHVEGYSLRPQLGRLTWNRGYDEVVVLGQINSVDLRQHKAITPNQSRKAGLSEETIATYSHKPHRGFKLVRDDLSTAKRIFSK